MIAKNQKFLNGLNKAKQCVKQILVNVCEIEQDKDVEEDISNFLFIYDTDVDADVRMLPSGSNKTNVFYLFDAVMSFKETSFYKITQQQVSKSEVNLRKNLLSSNVKVEFEDYEEVVGFSYGVMLALKLVAETSDAWFVVNLAEPLLTIYCRTFENYVFSNCCETK